MKSQGLYIADKLNGSNYKDCKDELVEFIRYNTNVEMGGYKLWDGSRTHLTQNPWELADFIIALKEYEEKTGKKLKSYLDIGFSSGITNSFFNKFFDFDHIVGVDIFSYQINGVNLHGNIVNKELTLVCGDSGSERVKSIVNRLGMYDLLFIDADHSYSSVKSDFDTYREVVSQGGVIAFHDISNPDWPGTNEFWEQLKGEGAYDVREFICKGYKYEYGIGMVVEK